MKRKPHAPRQRSPAPRAAACSPPRRRRPPAQARHIREAFPELRQRARHPVGRACPQPPPGTRRQDRRHPFRSAARQSSAAWRTAVFRPEKEKSSRLSPRSGRGRANLAPSPCSAAFSTSGPPGKGRPSSLAVLSNASPSASSIVRRPALILADAGDKQNLRVAAGDQQKQIRKFQIVGQPRGERMSFKMIDGKKRFAERGGDGLCRSCCRRSARRSGRGRSWRRWRPRRRAECPPFRALLQ